MNKIGIAIIASITALILFVVIIAFKNQKLNQSTSQTPISESAITPTTVPKIPVKKYFDPSGFEFEYPNQLTMSNVTPLKNSYYADIEGTASGKIEKLSIILESTIVPSLSEFIKSNKQIPSSTTKTRLADLEAIEYTTKDTFTTIAIDQGALITISTPKKDEKYWSPIHKIITSSFKFVQPTSSVSNTNDSSGSYDDGGVIFEGEETIE